MTAWLLWCLSSAIANPPGLCPEGYLLDGEGACARWLALESLPASPVRAATAGDSGVFALAGSRLWRRSADGQWVAEPGDWTGDWALTSVGARIVAIGERTLRIRETDGWAEPARIPDRVALPESSWGALHPLGTDQVVTRSGWRLRLDRMRWISLRTNPIRALVPLNNALGLLHQQTFTVIRSAGRPVTWRLPARGARIVSAPDSVLAIDGLDAWTMTGPSQRHTRPTEALWHASTHLLQLDGRTPAALGGHALSLWRDGRWVPGLAPPTLSDDTRWVSGGGLTVGFDGTRVWALERLSRELAPLTPGYREADWRALQDAATRVPGPEAL